MDADEQILKSVSKIEYYQSMLSFLDSILKTILNRTYQIKNAIEYMRFTAGYGRYYYPKKERSIFKITGRTTYIPRVVRVFYL